MILDPNKILGLGIEYANQFSANFQIVCPEKDKDTVTKLNIVLVGIDSNKQKEEVKIAEVMELYNKKGATIVIASFFTLQQFKDYNKGDKEIQYLVTRPNIRFLRLPFTPTTLLNHLLQEAPITQNQDDTAKAEQELYDYKISILKHDLKNLKNSRNTEHHEQFIERAKEYFPDWTDKTDQEIIQYVEESNLLARTITQTKEMEGVYCDIEGTLIVDSKVNSAVLSQLADFELKEGKKITLWSGGDITSYRDLLPELNITYPLISKFSCRGFTVEVAIDDLDENELKNTYGISAKRFIRVAKK